LIRSVEVNHGTVDRKENNYCPLGNSIASAQLRRNAAWIHTTRGVDIKTRRLLLPNVDRRFRVRKICVRMVKRGVEAAREMVAPPRGQHSRPFNWHRRHNFSSLCGLSRCRGAEGRGAGAGPGKRDLMRLVGRYAPQSFNGFSIDFRRCVAPVSD
jgi:hypothetical protein